MMLRWRLPPEHMTRHGWRTISGQPLVIDTIIGLTRVNFGGELVEIGETAPLELLANVFRAQNPIRSGTADPNSASN